MPDKPLTIATYAAGASLAAITLVYVFAPTYFIDSDSNSARKKGVVGLTNPANDCFINSVLQALAGLTDLRIYLIRETHRRTIDERWVYEDIVADPARKSAPKWRVEGLQAGIVTKGLKDMLDALNERPIYRKTISAAPFVKVLETAFRQRISRQQQDAQEFLQVVAERLCDEYHAGRKARERARRKVWRDRPRAFGAVDGIAVDERLAELTLDDDKDETEDSQDSDSNKIPTIHEEFAGDFAYDEEESFPMEGKYESQIECQTCGFKPAPTESTFCTLTLSVPLVNSTTLNACLDGMFKTEYVDDFKCEKCRLVHAKEVLEAELRRSTSESFIEKTTADVEKLQKAIDTDPEQPPNDVVLPDMRYAPKRKIARHTRITSFPKVLAIHLSRSIYDASMSTKNSAKVAFPERLPMGGLLQKKKYKLLGTVTHKGSHSSGHYESFRRQNVNLPFSTPHAFQQSNVFTKSAQPSPIASPMAATPAVATPRALTPPTLTPQVSAAHGGSPSISMPDLISPTSSGSSSNPSASDLRLQQSTDSIPRSIPSSSDRSSPRKSPISAVRDQDSDAISFRSIAASAKSRISKISHSVRNSRSNSPVGFGRHALHINGAAHGTVVAPTSTNGTSAKSASSVHHHSPRRRHSDRWWRISDEKIKEAKTSEVLGMQREVYLLFYELEREHSPVPELVS